MMSKRINLKINCFPFKKETKSTLNLRRRQAPSKVRALFLLAFRQTSDFRYSVSEIFIADFAKAISSNRIHPWTVFVRPKAFSVF